MPIPSHPQPLQKSIKMHSFIFSDVQSTPKNSSPTKSKAEKEIKVLKTMVHRLNQELSKYQTRNSDKSEITSLNDDTLLKVTTDI